MLDKITMLNKKSNTFDLGNYCFKFYLYSYDYMNSIKSWKTLDCKHVIASAVLL